LKPEPQVFIVGLRSNSIDGLWLFGLAYLQYGPDDFVVAGATAEVAGQPVADATFIGVWFLVQQAFGGQQETRCADTALKSGVLQEGLLQGVQALRGSHALHGRDVFAFCFDTQYQARVYDPAVHQNRAGATVSVVAAFLCSSHPYDVTEAFQEALTRLA
jgi:hypothetical protein